MSKPSVWDAIVADPTVPIDRDVLRLVVADQQLWSRRWLYPWLRVLCRVIVLAVLVVKRFTPAGLSAHSTMDRMCLWFLRRMVDPVAVSLLIRHFVVETNLLNFVVGNAGVPGLEPVTLRPTTLDGLGDRAVIEHDLNMYEVMVGLGRGWRHGDGAAAAPPEQLDYSMLTIPRLDARASERRWLRLDIQTALALMTVPFAVCLTADEYRHAVHSLRLDETLLAVLSEITGDPTFRAWRPAGSVVRVDSAVDAARLVYEHAIICEYAHGRLVGAGTRIATRRAGPARVRS